MTRGLLVAIVLTSHAALAQPTSGEVRPLFPPVQFEKLGLEDGLPQIHVTSIVQDTRGFLWIGTQAGGLARYSGGSMLAFSSDPSDPSSVSSQFVTVLQADPSGLVWVGTGDAGLNVYDPGTHRFTRYRHDDNDPGSLGFDAVTALEVDPDGTLWIGLANGGVDRFDAATKRFQHVVSSDFSEGGITAIQSDGKGTLWIASNGSGVMTVTNAKSTEPKATWLSLEEGVSRNVTALLVDSAGVLWIGTEDAGLVRVRDGKVTSYVPRPGDRGSLSSEKVTSLFEDRDKRLWIGTQAGLNELDPARKKLTRYAPDAEYPLRTATYLQFVTTMFQDNAGILWFGTLDFGLYKLDPLRRAFRNYAGTAEFGIPMAFCDGRDGIVWAGTYSHGLYALDFQKEVYTAYPALSDGERTLSLTDWLTTVHCARDGAVWIGGSGLGLVRFEPATGRFVQYPADPEGVQGPVSDRIEQIIEDQHGMLWLAGWGGGLSRFDPKTRTFKVVTRDEKVLPSAYLHRILFDVADPQVLWIGAAQGGLIRLDLRTTTSKVVRGRGAATGTATKSMLSSDNVLSLYQEPGGLMWVGTDGGGLDSYDPATGTVTNYGLKQGLASNVIYGILRDDANQLWLTTSKGLIRFDLATKQAVTFTSADGLGSTEFNQNGYFRSKTGELLVSTLTGFNRFEPAKIVPDTFVPPVVLTGFRLFDKEAALPRPIWDLEEIDLSYQDSVFAVDFAALAYAAPKLTRYQYMLDGFRDEWLTTDRGSLTFTNLDPGNYVLKIKAINRHGVASETPAELRIHVEPPLWRTKWAYAVYVVLLLGAGVLVIHLQRERVRRAEREGRLALVEQELQLTGAVQSGFLPDHNEIATENVQIVAMYKPADSCSGDWWWHARLGGTRHVVMVGDVTGHGAGPAMVTAAVATACNVYASTQSQVDIVDMLELFNREVLRVGKGKYQMALAALEIDEATGQWLLHSAAAPPMLTLDARGKHRVHFCPGSLLGTPTNFELGTISGTLAPGERILLYTDGIPEIQLRDGNMIGTRRFAQLYERTRPHPVPLAAASIMSFAEEALAGQTQLDDWTFAIVEWTDRVRSF